MIEICLPDSEVLELKITHQKLKDGKSRDKIKAILMLHDGYYANEVARALLIDQNTLTEWKKQYLKREDIKQWLSNNCEGYSGKLTDSEIKSVDNYVFNNLISDSKQVQKFILDKFGKSFSVSGVVAMLRRLNFSYKQTILIPAKHDSEKQKLFKEFFEMLIDTLKGDEALLFSDAVHPQHNTKSTHAWIKVGQEKHIPSNSGRKRLNIIGAYNPLNQDLITHEDKTINSQSVIDFLKKVEAFYPNLSTIFMLTDQASYYKNKEVDQYLKTSRIVLIYLPT